MSATKAMSVAILAMGGEGGGVLADWIADAAERAGYFAQATSVPGVAQRTGSTIYYVELFPDGGRQPVLSLMPVPGYVDVVVASELMEAGRAVQRGLVTPDRTTLIASTHRVYSMTERTAIGDGRVDSEALLTAIRSSARRLVCDDFAATAAATGSVISAVLLGALAGSEALPLRRDHFEEAIRQSGVGVESSLRAFAAGLSCGASQPSPAPPAENPPAGDDVVLAAVERLTDYQDAGYAEEFLSRLAGIRATGDALLLRETARYLALWMSYEDAIRVADLKTRRDRFERVRREAGAQAGQVLEIHEFLHPRVEEIADVLPAALGRWLLRTGWTRRAVERLTRHGRVVQTTSVTGFLQLRLLAKLRRWRRHTLRFQREQERMRAWLAEVEALARQDPALALEAAECPRLLKGYGDTYARGSRNFDVVMGALAGLRGQPGAAARLKQLREAALSDETGDSLHALTRPPRY